ARGEGGIALPRGLSARGCEAPQGALDAPRPTGSIARPVPRTPGGCMLVPGSLLRRARLHWLLLLSAAFCATTAVAADFSRLAKDLTPVGAERAGNADGTIPAWE